MYNQGTAFKFKASNENTIIHKFVLILSEKRKTNNGSTIITKSCPCETKRPKTNNEDTIIHDIEIHDIEIHDIEIHDIEENRNNNHRTLTHGKNAIALVRLHPQNSDLDRSGLAPMAPRRRLDIGHPKEVSTELRWWDGRGGRTYFSLGGRLLVGWLEWKKEVRNF
jgi:hypothetical protein